MNVEPRTATQLQQSSGVKRNSCPSEALWGAKNAFLKEGLSLGGGVALIHSSAPTGRCRREL
jgi:hypothetical protein